MAEVRSITAYDNFILIDKLNPLDVSRVEYLVIEPKIRHGKGHLIYSEEEEAIGDSSSHDIQISSHEVERAALDLAYLDAVGVLMHLELVDLTILSVPDAQQLILVEPDEISVATKHCALPA